MANKRLIGVAFFLALVAGCSAIPPQEEILRQLADNAAGNANSEAVPATPEDAAAIKRAAAEIQEHVRSRRQQAAVTSGSPKTDYEVSVTAPRSMAGTWRMISPDQIAIHGGAPDQYGDVRNFLCRIDQAAESLQGSCLPTRVGLDGRIREGAVHLSWGNGVFNAKISGRLLTPTDFAGSLIVDALGVNIVGSEIPVYATKIPSSIPAPPEIDIVAARLFADLGSVRERLYLGAVDAQLEKPEAMHVFDVELEKEWKLCGFTSDGGHLECR